MADFKQYTTTLGAAGEVPAAELDALIARHEWFTTARIIRAVQYGGDDERLNLTAAGRLPGLRGVQRVNGAALTAVSSEEIIDRFLREENLRVVVDEGEAGEEVRIEAELSDEDDLVSEELAEIYLAQGLHKEAIDTYRKLSLRNPEKSVYFAEIIEKIETNN